MSQAPARLFPGRRCGSASRTGRSGVRALRLSPRTGSIRVVPPKEETEKGVFDYRPRAAGRTAPFPSSSRRARHPEETGKRGPIAGAPFAGRFCPCLPSGRSGHPGQTCGRFGREWRRDRSRKRPIVGAARRPSRIFWPTAPTRPCRLTIRALCPRLLPATTLLSARTASEVEARLPAPETRAQQGEGRRERGRPPRNGLGDPPAPGMRNRDLDPVRTRAFPEG